MLLANLKWTVKAPLYILIIGVTLWGIGAVIDYSTSLAVVNGGVTPGLAAVDPVAFEAAIHPSEVTHGISELKASGRVVSVAEGTRCRVIQNLHESCQGRHYAARVKLLDGPRRGQIVWMCSDSFDNLYKWP
jgi:hypothetical protein